MKTNYQHKIMHVNYTMNIGGIETFIMNMIRNTVIKPEKIVVLTYADAPFDYEEELIRRGIKIIRITNPHHISTFKHVKELHAVIASERVDAIHAHTYFDSAFVVAIAWMSGVKVRIAHSHTAMAHLEKRLVKKIKWMFARLLLYLFATHKLACSEVAGKALFGSQKFTIVPNGINLPEFAYRTATRNALRKKLGIPEDVFVIGHVGRLDKPKNHAFLIDIFKSFLRINPDSRLVLIGSGKLKGAIEEKIASLRLERQVILLGDRGDIKDLLNIFDYFVFPSIYEGLPVSLIEAQANGLTVLVSDTVSHEIKVSDAVQFLSLKESAEEWASHIRIGTPRITTTGNDRLKKYDIQSTVHLIEGYYAGEART